MTAATKNTDTLSNLSIYSSIHLYYLYIYIYTNILSIVYFSVSLSTHLSYQYAFLCLILALYLSIYLSIYLSVFLSIYLSIYPSNAIPLFAIHLSVSLLSVISYSINGSFSYKSISNIHSQPLPVHLLNISVGHLLSLSLSLSVCLSLSLSLSMKRRQSL